MIIILMTVLNTSIQYRPFSVAMCVYGKDNSDWFDDAFKSIVEQTVNPNEIVLVIDGPIPQSIQFVINKYTEICVKKGITLNIIYQKINQGLGLCLKTAVENSKNELIARMDSDDISVPERFEKLLRCFHDDSSLSIVGGAITEFIDTPQNIVAKKRPPLNNVDIRKYMKSRNGFNHVTVMFRKSEVMKVGNYQHLHYNEDYFLWIRMMLAGCKFANLPDILVNVRVGREMYERRGGLKYFKIQNKLQKYMLQNRVISFTRYCYNMIGRFVVQVVIPNWLRALVFQKLFRK